MTPEDKQIDLLMRRHAQNASRTEAADHLDADEMNAFAEGKVPSSARAQYVSHLADCDQCRQQVSLLAISAGAVSRLEAPVAEQGSRSFWQAFAGLFALPVLRYAAFAAVLVLIAGVALLVVRRSRESDLVAVNQPATQPPASAVKNLDSANENKQPSTASSAPTAQPSGAALQNPKADESKVAGVAVPTTPVMKDAPIEVEKRAAQPEVAAKAPSYAPPPPGESQTASREQQNVGGAGVFSGPQKAEAVDKLASTGRERDAAKESRKADDSSRLAMNQPAPAQKSVDEKPKGPSRNFENMRGRNLNEGRAAAPKTSMGTDNRTATEEEPATRSAGGRKFRKQGNAWVDQKFKSSMTLKSISRGSEEFNALDSGLRSIAQQLGGEVIVVWKGKAYLIH